MRILFLDHFDSFTYNLVALLKDTFQGAEVLIFSPNMNWERFVEKNSCEFNLIVLGPGPGRPSDYPYLVDIINTFVGQTPIFGLCLGMQALNEYFSGETIKADPPCHGKIHKVKINPESVNHPYVRSLPNSFQVMRYHSLVIQPSNEWQILAQIGNMPMMVGHKQHKILGCQFHIESFGSEYGREILKSFYEA